MKKKVPKIDVATARELLSTLTAHVRQLHPEVNPKPKKRQLTAAAMTARSINASMGIVRTSIQAAKLSAEQRRGLDFLELKEVKSEGK